LSGNQNNAAGMAGLGGLLGTGLMATSLAGGFSGMGSGIMGLIGPSFKY
jgi:hypothetical protein